MKVLDKVIRYWRVKVALRYRPNIFKSVLDIGCDDGYLLKHLDGNINRKEGIDPILDDTSTVSDIKLWNGYFPQVIERHQIKGPYDAIFSLAVFEHFSENDLASSAVVINNLLSPTGRLIVTVPHPFVDKILDFLISFKLIDGQAVDEHHGFEPDELKKLFSEYLNLIEHKKFQFGLNNVFVFMRK